MKRLLFHLQEVYLAGFAAVTKGYFSGVFSTDLAFAFNHSFSGAI